MGGLPDAHRGRRIPGVVLGLVEEKLQQDIVGFEGRVRGQLAAPETSRRLLRKQSVGGLLKRRGELLARSANLVYGLEMLGPPRGFRPF